MKKKRLSKMEPLPCIRKKCLKYPVCRHKEKIKCEELNTYYHRVNLLFELKIIWKKINKSFPSLHSIDSIKVGDTYYPGTWQPVEQHHQKPYGVKRSKDD